MLHKIGLVLVSSLLAITGFSQHCRYDGSSFIMLDIRTNTGVKIDKILLLDSSGQIVISKHYAGGKVTEEKSAFHKNDPEKANVEFGTKENFRFAKDYQVLALGAHDQPMPYRIAIHYSKGGKSIIKEVPLLPNHLHTLCTNNTELWSGKSKPMIVFL